MNYSKLNKIFIVVVIILLIISQLVIQYMIDRGNHDSIVVNYSGRQRMLSQNISKTLLILENKNDSIKQSDIDSLQLFVSGFENISTHTKVFTHLYFVNLLVCNHITVSLNH